MPKPRTPTRILDIRNAFKKHPERRKLRQNEPTENAPLGDPPSRLNEVQSRIWREVQSELVDGVALASDRRAFGTLVRLLEREERGELDKGDLAQMTKLYERFGMTPADRSRVQVAKDPNAKNRFGKLG